MVTVTVGRDRGKMRYPIIASLWRVRGEARVYAVTDGDGGCLGTVEVPEVPWIGEAKWYPPKEVKNHAS